MHLKTLAGPLFCAALLASCGEPAPPAAAPAPMDSKAADRKELVLQPRRGWAPPVPGAKLEINLILEKSRIRRGEAFGYRMEIRNMGGTPAVFKEPAPSFIKEGGLCGGRYVFYLTPPRGKEERLACAPEEGPAPEGSALDVVLAPGEYLLTRPARGFRPLRAKAALHRLGAHRLRVVLKDGASSAASAPVSFEVVP